MKSKTLTKKHIEERTKFLGVWKEFLDWMLSIGFRWPNTNEDSNLENHMSFYEDALQDDNLSGVDSMILDAINLRLFFERGHNTHKIIFIGEYYTCTQSYTIEEAKKIIIAEVIAQRDHILNKLKPLQNIKPYEDSNLRS